MNTYKKYSPTAKQKASEMNELRTAIKILTSVVNAGENNCDMHVVNTSVCDHSHGFYFDEKGIITCVRCHPPKKKAN